MKTIGLIGGLSWESTSEYYRIINQYVNKLLGGLHSAKIILYSFDFQEVASLQHDQKWVEATSCMTTAAQTLEKAGAEMIVICTNTMHMMADEVKDSVSIPLIHIVDVVADRIKEIGLHKVGLLGTRFTMEQPFYKNILAKHNIEVVIPTESGRTDVHEIIYEELCRGVIKEESKEKYIKVVDELAKEGAQGVILGCTEIPLLLKQEDTPIPLFDTTQLHALAAVELALSNKKEG